MKVMEHTVRFLTIMGIYSDNVEVTTVWEVLRFLYISNTAVYIVTTQGDILYIQF